MKPKPPADLWETLDAEVRKSIPTPPKDAFTISDYRRRYNLSDDRARYQLSILVEKGAIESIGKFGSHHIHYYVLRRKE